MLAGAFCEDVKEKPFSSGLEYRLGHYKQNKAKQVLFLELARTDRNGNEIHLGACFSFPVLQMERFLSPRKLSDASIER